MAAIGAVAPVPTALSAELMGQPGSAELQIEILTGKAAPGDSVILRNTTTEMLRIESFQPGIIACRDSILDLNQLCKSHSLILQPMQVMPAALTRWQILAAPAMKHGYLLADDSATAVSADTDLVLLVAAVRGGNAIVASGDVEIS